MLLAYDILIEATAFFNSSFDLKKFIAQVFLQPITCTFYASWVVV